MCPASENPKSRQCTLDVVKESEALGTASTRDYPPMDKGMSAYQYLVAMFTIETVVWGFATSFGVLLNFYQHDPRSPIKPTPNSKLILTLVGTINTGTIAGAAPLVSFWIAKNPGIRARVRLFGLITCALTMFLSAYSDSAIHILLSQGIGYGIGGCALYYSALSHLPEWFEKKRGFATGVIFTGTGLGGLSFPLILDSLLGRYGPKVALQIVTVLFTIPTVLAVCFIRPRGLPDNPHHDTLGQAVMTSEKQALPISTNLFRNFYRCLTGAFWIYIFLNTVQSTVFYLPGLYLPTYSHCLGRGNVTGSALLSIVNAGTIFAQLAAGFLSDHYSPFLIGAIANILGGTSVLIIWGALGHLSIVWLFVFSAFYGSTAGAWTSLYFRVLKPFISDQDLVFSAYGILSMTRGLGNILGGPISSALVTSISSDPHKCSGFPKGPFSGLIWFTGLAFIICGLIGSALWIHLRPKSGVDLQNDSKGN